jgi:hypothetical protein
MFSKGQINITDTNSNNNSCSVTKEEAIFLVSLNAFSVAFTPLITISTNHVSATSGTTITPVTITNIGEPAFIFQILHFARSV